MRKIIAILCVCFSAQTLAAQVESSKEIVFQASTRPEAKLGFTQRFKFPFLQGDGPLTEGNNIKVALTAEVSPVSLNGIAEAVLTPIAFLEFNAGLRIGSGWNISLFGGKVYGIGTNRDDGYGYAKYDGSPFDGLTFQGKAGGAFQFDLAALLPGDWNHVIFRTYHEINYGSYTRAKAGDAWCFENKKEYTNGFIYYSNYVLGYQMPIFLNMIALMTEAEKYLYDLPDRSSWGDQRIKWVFGGILNFAVFEQLDITLITQFRTMRNYLQSDWEDIYYRNRILNTSNPLRLEFYRVAAIVTYKF
jgi:hypothetical protein